LKLKHFNANQFNFYFASLNLFSLLINYLQMSITIQEILLDAKRLAYRLKEHDSAADELLSQSQSVFKQINAMKQVQKTLPLKKVISWVSWFFAVPRRVVRLKRGGRTSAAEGARCQHSAGESSAPGAAAGESGVESTFGGAPKRLRADYVQIQAAYLPTRKKFANWFWETGQERVSSSTTFSQ
jgi:hypothetical protein